MHLLEQQTRSKNRNKNRTKNRTKKRTKNRTKKRTKKRLTEQNRTSTLEIKEQNSSERTEPRGGSSSGSETRSIRRGCTC
ncbi:probable splicing factor, arginine/serine-rich 6 [Cebidichthys violaceus]|uniref:probable splicing factor, arginine/serine-rich 6 n=1 Tax=Cebidichthys violaceus TaxID=271503 RepID=UPI0035CC1157